MTKKILIARLGIGTLTVAFCAALPGCNLGAMTIHCGGTPDVCSNPPAADGASDAAEAGTDGTTDTDGP